MRGSLHAVAASTSQVEERACRDILNKREAGASSGAELRFHLCKFLARGCTGLQQVAGGWEECTRIVAIGQASKLEPKWQSQESLTTQVSPILQTATGTDLQATKYDYHSS